MVKVISTFRRHVTGVSSVYGLRGSSARSSSSLDSLASLSVSFCSQIEGRSGVLTERALVLCHCALHGSHCCIGWLPRWHSDSDVQRAKSRMGKVRSVFYRINYSATERAPPDSPKVNLLIHQVVTVLVNRCVLIS